MPGGGLPGLGPRPTVVPGMMNRTPGQTNFVSTPRPAAPEKIRHASSLNGKPIGQVPDFISEEERTKLLHFVTRPAAPWETYLPESDVWHGRMINPRSMPPAILRLMKKIRARIVDHIKADYDIDEPVYCDTLQLVRWRVGDKQAPHADCEEPDGRPNHSPWRAFASMVYLNDEYEGGELHFPQRNFTPDISPRMLAYFPSTRNYMHGVKPVTAGIRYTMSCFYTFDPRHHDGHDV